MSKLDFDLGATDYNFTDKYGTFNTTQEPEPKKKADAASIINASAGGLDSVTSFVSLFTGTQPNNQNTYEPQPQAPQKQGLSPLAIGGIVGGVVLLIALLIFSKNGKQQA